jgi:hypothetical protein
MPLNPDCSFVHTIPAGTIAAEEARIRSALQKGGYRRAKSVPLGEAAIGSLIEGLHDAADDLSIQNYSLDHQIGCDGSLAVTADFATEADMVLFKIRVR